MVEKVEFKHMLAEILDMFDGDDFCEEGCECGECEGCDTYKTAWNMLDRLKKEIKEYEDYLNSISDPRN